MRLELLAIPALAIGAVTASASAFAVDYLSPDQAARLMFPTADRFEARSITLDAVQLRQLQARGVQGRSARWPVQVARQGGQILGFVVTDRVIGKVELIDYAVGIGLDGQVRQIEILSYRESHGFEIRLPAWRRQFVGKNESSAIKVGDDISNISGATLSCTHVTDGVRRIVAVVSEVRRSGALE